MLTCTHTVKDWWDWDLYYLVDFTLTGTQQIYCVSRSK